MGKKYSNHNHHKGQVDSNKSLFDGDGYDSAFDPKKGNAQTKDWKSGYQACYHSHPVLELGGGKIIGGSCSMPVTDTADIYIGFDYGMKMRPTKPWRGGTPPVQALFEVTDMQAPKDAEDYKEMILWVCLQLAEGKTIHFGCIGGHGRTGMAIAAVYKTITGEEDAITKIRELYCEKAVESQAQVDFLHTHFGIKKVNGYKQSWQSTKSTASTPVTYKGSGGSGAYYAGGAEFKSIGNNTMPSSSTSFKNASRTWDFVKTSGTIFGQVL